ncbi:MAG: strawberry notch family protein [Pyrinomonadaceae bacterium]
MLVEPPGLANVEPPPLRYRPRLPKDLSETGKLSAMQLERIIYAGQAHEQRLADGSRAGISIGDGTGTGKTATLAGVILDNWFHGRRRAVWFSVKADLIEAVSDEFKRLGLTPPIKLINDFPTDQEIDIQDGIVFCTYRSLIARSKKGNKRLDQITRWLRPSGVVIFDEGHKAKYAFADDRGKSTQTGAAVLEIQNPERFPDVRVVYSSATSAGEARHLANMSRLGLWGAGTNFPIGFEQFAEEIESGGIVVERRAVAAIICGMPKIFSAAGPHEVHQLLVSVSKHYLVGTTGIIRHQKKAMDVSLRNYQKSDRVHLVYYILRDRFTGFYYVEVVSTKNLIPLQDFLLRAFLPKPDIYFGGLPKVLLVPKDVESMYPQIIDFLNGLRILKVNPASGFDSGIIAVKDWERTMKCALIPDTDLDNIAQWNPRTAIDFLDTYNSDNYEHWKMSVPEDLFCPSDEFLNEFASPAFKRAEEYPRFLPEWRLKTASGD